MNRGRLRCYTRVMSGLRALGPALLIAASVAVCGGCSQSPGAASSTLIADPPALVSPASGSLQMRHPTLVVRYASHTGKLGTNGTLYEFLVSRDPESPGAVACTAVESSDPGINSTSCTLGELSPGTYYWRARTVVGRRPDFSGVTSALSSAWTFTVVQVTLQNPVPVSPPYGANVHPRPTLTVSNSGRTGPTGALSYVFELFGSGGSAIATAKVFESGTETSWTVPFDLSTGTYGWRVHAIDPAIGLSSGYSLYTSFRVLASRATLYTLVIDFPAPCFQTHLTIYTSSTDSSAGGPFSVVDNYNLRLNSTIVGRGLSGSIGGTTSLFSYSVVISNARGSALPAPLTGIVGDDGRIAGTFSGFVDMSSTIGGPLQCSAPNIGWSLTPQSP